VSLTQARALRRWTYARAKRETEARVVRWEWASFTRYSLEPHYFERHRFRRGDVLARPKRGAHGHGFDAEGRLCVERRLTEFEGRFYETFYAPKDGGIARRHFDYSPEKRSINDAFFEIEDGCVSRIDTVYARGNRASEVFHWDRRHRLASVDRSGPEGKSTYRMIWDSRGLARVDWIANKKTCVQWRRVERGTGLIARRAALENGLARAIRTTLENDPPEAPVYAIALWWCIADWQHRFPPELAIATAPQRDRFFAEEKSRALDFVWSPPEWGDDRSIRLDRKLARICEDASSDVWQNDLQSLADDAVRSIARKIGRPRIPTTKDFVAYAVQVDVRETARQQLARQLDAKKRAAFEKRGWL
jgi:hypothetical protein